MGRISGKTKESIERETDAALEQTNGDRDRAAKILGIGVGGVDQRIRRHMVLRMKWGVRPPPPAESAESEEVTISRPTITPPPVQVILPPPPPEPQLPVIVASDVAVAKAMDEEDERIKAGIARLGLSEAELRMAASFQSFQRRWFTTSFDMIGGGITKQFLSLCTEIDSINKRLSEPQLPAIEAILREDRSRLLAIQVQMYDRAARAALTQAEINARRNGGGKDNKPAKPAFAPLVKVEQGGNVHIHEAQKH